MKIATSSNFFSSSCAEGIKRLGEIGFDVVELIYEKPHVFTDISKKEDIRTLNDLKRKFEMEIIVHAAFYDLNGASWNEGARRETVRQYKEAIELAHRIDSKVVVIHLGERSTEIVDTKKSLNQNLKTLRECVNAAEKYGILLALENTGFDESLRLFNKADDIKNIIKEISSDNLRVTFDIAHAFLQKLDLYSWIHALSPYIEHIHIHDNHGVKDEHLPLLMGDIDFTPAFKALREINYNKTFGLEIINRGYSPNILLESKEYILKSMKGD